jgi:L-ascorbate metabolism protein UlaG (beta-lactamase superfamily)
MKTKFRKRMTILLTALIIVAVGGFLFLQTEVFGQTPTGKRLERIKKSPHFRDGKFNNEHFTPDLVEGVSYWDILKSYFKKVENKTPEFVLPSVVSDLKKISALDPKIVWFGHSSYLLFINGKTILVDPVFSGNASPVSFFGKNYEGSNVYSVKDMPDIDVLIISHDHYDHLDHKTVKALLPKVKQVVTSLGTGAHLEKWGYNPNIINELDWTEHVIIDSVLHFTSTPARHFSGRGLKRNQAFWSSFVLKTPTHNIFIGGDSGYDTHFKDIGEKYGPFDLAILECGQYNYFWKYIHTMPEETALAATDLKAKMLLPVHWAKFTLALHPWTDPIERVTKEAERLKMPIMTPMIGEVSTLSNSPDPAHKNKKWWRF